MVRQVIDPTTWDRAAWFAGMAEHAAEMAAEGADADLLARFEAAANQWLVNQGSPTRRSASSASLVVRVSSNG